MSTFFKVLHNSKKSNARLGEINTVHGKVKTPGFIAAATKGTIKTLTSEQVKEIGIQAACFNTYHLVTHPGADVIAKAGGIHKYSGLNVFAMSDSGGFQVFSLARNSREKMSLRAPKGRSNLKKEIASSSTSSPPRDDKRVADIRGEEQPLLVKISEDGVKFRSTFDGKLIEFTPEKSMEYQVDIGADINMAFDECTYYPSSHEYASRAMDRTHRWLERCIQYQKNSKFEIRNLKSNKNNLSIKNLNIKDSLKINNFKFKINQYLYGVIQGGIFEDLRKKSAEFVVSQNTPGVAIGGVSVGETKKEMRDQVKWVSDYLPKDRPVHLLGVGQMDDIVDLVKYGIDTFDCVEPTRLARMGIIYQISKIKDQKHILNIKNEEIDITKFIFRNNLEKLDVNCNCYVCNNFTKSYIHHLFKQREILGYTLATYHNLWFMEKLFEYIRDLIKEDYI